MQEANSIGHAFYALTQGDVTCVMGFYPNNAYAFYQVNLVEYTIMEALCTM